MIVDIFDKEPLEFEAIDFSMWVTEDGDYLPLEELEDEEIIHITSNLHRRLKMQPEHYNAQIWEEYLEVCMKLCKQRKLPVKNCTMRS